MFHALAVAIEVKESDAASTTKVEQSIGFIDGEHQVASQTQDPARHPYLKQVLGSTGDLHPSHVVNDVGQEVHYPLGRKVADLDRSNEVIMVVSHRLRRHANRPRWARLKFHRFEATTRSPEPSWVSIPKLSSFCGPCAWPSGPGRQELCVNFMWVWDDGQIMSLPRTSRSVAARLSLALSASLVLAACGGGEEPIIDAGAQLEATTTPTVEPTTTEASTTTAAPPTTVGPTTTEARSSQAPAPASQVPDVAVTNVNTGDSVSLQSVAGTGTPVALWFWFPH